MRKINIVMVTDSKYFIQTSVTICSILENSVNKSSYVFWIFCYDLNKKPQLFTKIENKYLCLIKFINTSKYNYYFKNQSVGDFQNKYISFVTYHRLLMYKILPSYVDIAIYVDSDIIVRKDLSLLIDKFDSKKYIFAAVKEPDDIYAKNAHSYLKGNAWFKAWERNHYDAPYFNAGFFITNIKESKKMNVFDKFIEFLNDYRPKLADQDTLNAVFGQLYRNRIKYLPPIYNLRLNLDYEIIRKSDVYNYSYIELKKSLEDPFVIHFDGRNKPWNTNCKFYKCWWEYASILKLRLIKMKIKKNINLILRAIFPDGSKRRLILKKILTKLR